MINFEIFKDKINEFRFRLKADNGEIILASEGYKAKSSCKNGIKSVIKNSLKDSNFKRLKSKNLTDYYFILKARNGRVIGVSEMYTTTWGMEVGIKSVSENVLLNSDILDLT